MAAELTAEDTSDLEPMRAFLQRERIWSRCVWVYVEILRLLSCFRGD